MVRNKNTLKHMALAKSTWPGNPHVYVKVRLESVDRQIPLRNVVAHCWLPEFTLTLEGRPSGDVRVYHRNGDPKDCRAENLVVFTKQEAYNRGLGRPGRPRKAKETSGAAAASRAAATAAPPVDDVGLMPVAAAAGSDVVSKPESESTLAAAAADQRRAAAAEAAATAALVVPAAEQEQAASEGATAAAAAVTAAAAVKTLNKAGWKALSAVKAVVAGTVECFKSAKALAAAESLAAAANAAAREAALAALAATEAAIAVPDMEAAEEVITAAEKVVAAMLDFEAKLLTTLMAAKAAKAETGPKSLVSRTATEAAAAGRDLLRAISDTAEAARAAARAAAAASIREEVPSSRAGLSTVADPAAKLAVPDADAPMPAGAAAAAAANDGDAVSAHISRPETSAVSPAAEAPGAGTDGEEDEEEWVSEDLYMPMRIEEVEKWQGGRRIWREQRVQLAAKPLPLTDALAIAEQYLSTLRISLNALAKDVSRDLRDILQLCNPFQKLCHLQ